MKTKIAGIYYYDAKICHQKKLLSPNALLKLEREPTNPYDANAVIVSLVRPRKRYKLGYIPRDILSAFNNPDVFEGLDAKIIKVDDDENLGVTIEIKISLPLQLTEKKITSFAKKNQLKERYSIFMKQHYFRVKWRVQIK